MPVNEISILTAVARRFCSVYRSTCLLMQLLLLVSRISFSYDAGLSGCVRTCWLMIWLTRVHNIAT